MSSDYSISSELESGSFADICIICNKHRTKNNFINLKCHSVCVVCITGDTLYDIKLNKCPICSKYISDDIIISKARENPKLPATTPLLCLSIRTNDRCAGCGLVGACKCLIFKFNYNYINHEFLVDIKEKYTNSKIIKFIAGFPNCGYADHNHVWAMIDNNIFRHVVINRNGSRTYINCKRIKVEYLIDIDNPKRVQPKSKPNWFMKWFTK